MMRGHILFSTLFLIFATVSTNALAATLDDKSIHAFFDEYTSVMKEHDPEKVSQYMNKVLDDAFTLRSSSVLDTGAGAPQNANHAFDKAHAIAVLTDDLAAKHWDSYDRQVLDIKYSEDHKFAFAKIALAITATTNNKPQGNSGAPAGMHIQENYACVETLSLVGTDIKVMGSACNGTITVIK